MADSVKIFNKEKKKTYKNSTMFSNKFLKRDAENAVLNTSDKTASAIILACIMQIRVSLLLWLDMSVMKPKQ